MTEIGASYSYQKKNFNSENYYQTDSKTASVALYLIEKLALDFSYTDTFYESKEADTSVRVVQQSSQIYGLDLIYVLTHQQAAFQPFIKAGGAYITKKKLIKYENADAITIPTKDGMAPSYGLGLKYKITEKLSFKVSYDIWSTPLDDGTKSDDNAFRFGFTWYL